MSTQEEQLNLFVAIIGDIPFRDDRAMMSAPMVSIAKNSPTRMEWTGPKGQKVIVSGYQDTAIATIWDFDILIWAISQVNAAIERGEVPTRLLQFRPHDLMSSIGWSDADGRVGGAHYQRFKNAIARLKGTQVATTIRRRNKERLESFNLISEYTIDERDGKPLGATMELPNWIFKAVVESREVLAISPLYFELTGGLDRFLYRLARRHAGNGKDNPEGWVFGFRDLHKRTGSSARYSDFAIQLRKAISRDTLPEYSLSEEAGVSGPMLRLKFRRLTF